MREGEWEKENKERGSKKGRKRGLKEKCKIAELSLLSTVSNILRNKHQNLLLGRDDHLIHKKPKDRRETERERERNQTMLEMLPFCGHIFSINLHMIGALKTFQ